MKKNESAIIDSATFATCLHIAPLSRLEAQTALNYIVNDACKSAMSLQIILCHRLVKNPTWSAPFDQKPMGLLVKWNMKSKF